MTLEFILIITLFYSKRKISKIVYWFLIFLIYITISVILIQNPLTNDMLRYVRILENSRNTSFFLSLKSTRFEIGFSSYLWVLSRISTNQYVFMLTSLAIIYFTLLKGLTKILGNKHIILVLFGYMSLFVFWNMISNILRQGMAISFVILAFSCLLKKEYKKFIFYSIISFLFHSSAAIIFPFIILLKFKIKMKYYLLAYVSAAILMFTGMNRFLLTLFNQFNFNLINRLINYASQNTIDKYGATNRIDFFLFNSIWIIIFFIISKYMSNIHVREHILFKLYLYFTSFFMLIGFVAYSDRVAAYSWMLLPIILILPNNTKKHEGVYSLFYILIILVLFVYFGVYNRFLYMF
ncbi:EpsG family protein [Mycoplasmatota bacterium]|nr:EpsG family protein [Mycoplasmatota bacterium]